MNLEKAVHREGRKGREGKQITNYKPCYQNHQSGDCIRVHLGIDFLRVLGVLGGSRLGSCIKTTNLVIASGFTLALISFASFASLAVQMLDLG